MNLKYIFNFFHKQQYILQYFRCVSCYISTNLQVYKANFRFKSMEEKKQPMIYPNTLHCINKNQSIFICTSQSCKQTAFMCHDRSCDCIKTKHYGCSSHGTDYLVNSIEKHKKQTTEENKNTFDYILTIYEEMIERLSMQKEKFIDFTEMFGLEQSMRKFVGLIQDGKQNEINGNLAFKVHLEIMSKQQKTGDFLFDQKTVKRIWNEKKNQFQSIIQKLNVFRDQTDMIPIDSKITDSIGFKKIQTFLPKAIKKFQLLYRGSEHQFLAKKFHQKCDNIQDTLVLVQTEFNKIIGGYTPVKWQSPQTTKYKQDLLGESLLFSLSNNQKYTLSDKSKATYQGSSYGPLFGTNDLFINDKCNTDSSTQANIPIVYTNKNYTQRDQKSYNAFTGQTNGYHFKVKQYEVFKVIWK